MAVAARSVSSHHDVAADARDSLRCEWLSRRRVPADFDRLWDLYWDELGPLAAVPASIHEMEEVLIR